MVVSNSLWHVTHVVAISVTGGAGDVYGLAVVMSTGAASRRLGMLAPAE